MNTVLKQAFVRFALTVALLTGAAASHASVIGLTFTGVNLANSFDGTNMTIGWRFSVLDPITVSALGFWDQTPATPLSTSHRVGLWTDSGVLLASTTVLINDPLTDGFRFHAIAPVTLGAGIYHIGAEDGPFGDSYSFNVPTVTTHSSIDYLDQARNGSAQGFSFPDIVTAGNGRFGPNLLLDPAAAPEPITLSLLGLGLLGLGISRSRRPAA